MGMFDSVKKAIDEAAAEIETKTTEAIDKAEHDGSLRQSKDEPLNTDGPK